MLASNQPLVVLSPEMFNDITEECKTKAREKLARERGEVVTIGTPALARSRTLPPSPRRTDLHPIEPLYDTNYSEGEISFARVISRAMPDVDVLPVVRERKRPWEPGPAGTVVMGVVGLVGTATLGAVLLAIFRALAGGGGS